MAWLMFTKKTLRCLACDVETTPSINILEIYGWQRLEVLELSHNSITGVDPNYPPFPCLTSLCLRDVSISPVDLTLLLTACPKMENLTLMDLELENEIMADDEKIFKITSRTLRRIYVKNICLEKWIIEADNLEWLYLNDCAFEIFELIGKGALKYFKIEDVAIDQFDVGEAVDNLGTLDIRNFPITWSEFDQMFSRSSKLKWLRFWDLVPDNAGKLVDMEKVAICFPYLSYLALSYDLRFPSRHVMVDYGLHGSSLLENVIILELGWTVIHDYFTYLVPSLLKRCTNLKKLVIHEVMSMAKSKVEYQMLSIFTSSLFQLMRKYKHVDVKFVYK